MRKFITTLLLVLALAGYIGTANVAWGAMSDNYNEDFIGPNLFGVDEASNAAVLRDRDVGMLREIGTGDRWSPYNGFHHGDN